MAVLTKSRRLSKELGLLDVYAIATGATLSGGFFLLPSLAAQTAGPALVVSYLIAGLTMVPAVFCVVELATAMPRAGGAYYFVDRSLGPLAGTIGGVGTWLALVLKAAFALVGMGAYLSLFIDRRWTTLIPAILAIALGGLNLLSTRHTGRAQLFLVIGLLSSLGWFIGHGSTAMELRNFSGFFDAGGDAILSTAGLVYVSYIGVTKIASISEEVKNPERNLPLAVFLALATAIVVYGFGTVVMVGVVGTAELSQSITPVALVAERLLGRTGIMLVSVAAMLSFMSVANASILSSSRYPLAMSRDHLMPPVFARLNARGIPAVSVAATVGAILLFLVIFDTGQIAKLASAFQLVVFACLAFAVIVMRESHIDSYDPGYRSPAYPWMQLIGIAAPLWLIAEMGWMPLLFTALLFGFGIAWYFYYARTRVVRHGAIYHVFERLGRRRYVGLDRELRGILKEKGLREGDPFEEVVTRAAVVDLQENISFENLVDRAAALLAQRLPCSATHLAEGFLNGTRTGATPLARSAALPHLRLSEATRAEMVVVRCRRGVRIDVGDVFGGHGSSDSVYAVFFLVSPAEDPGQHLRLLAQLAGRIDDDAFLATWLEARDSSELTEVLLRDECYLSLSIRPGSPAFIWRGRALRQLTFPPGSLVALIHRAETAIVPSGATVLQDGDRLTVIGDRIGIQRLRAELSSKPPRRPERAAGG